MDFDFATPTLRKPGTFIGKDIKVYDCTMRNVVWELLFYSFIGDCFQDNVVDWNQIEWPILVLRGSGEVLIVRGNILHDVYVIIHSFRP